MCMGEEEARSDSRIAVRTVASYIIRVDAVDRHESRETGSIANLPAPKMFGRLRLWESSKFPIKINVMGKSTTKDASQHCYSIDQLRSGGRGQPWLQVNSGANEIPARPRPPSPGCSLLGGLRRLVRSPSSVTAQ
ncbi:hypothetical protein RRG08_011697 [Elysia crispata]|uniref:Uncharacterized protein n=1 Tax=Elysia crispata TaxID=231223 RepID=A0AAE1E7V2_9GAST|nr:hypothetical protein RRG08_011697 [Elysia crispata]